MNTNDDVEVDSSGELSRAITNIDVKQIATVLALSATTIIRI